jgi:hypothetical protein
MSDNLQKRPLREGFSYCCKGRQFFAWEAQNALISLIHIEIGE